MFHLQNITLLQPEAVIEPRLPGGSEALGVYLQAVRAVLAEHYASSTETGARSLVIGIGPDDRAQFWLAAPGRLSSDEYTSIQEISARVQAPQVVGGPILFALLYSVGAAPVLQDRLTLPTEWTAVAQRRGGPLDVDAIVNDLWAGAC